MTSRHCAYCRRELGEIPDEFSPPFTCYRCADAANGLDTTQAILLIVVAFAALYGVAQLLRYHSWSWPF